MRLDQFSSFRGVALDVGVLFFFSGEFTPTVVAALSDSLRRRLDERKVEGPVKRRLFSTFVEMAQNILHYAAEGLEADDADGWDDGAPARRGVVAMGADGEEFWVICGNPVPAAMRPRLEGKLTALAAMSRDQLHDAYRRQLLDDDHERTDRVSRGAGLGLLTMARASSGPLEWLMAEDPDQPGTLTFYLCARLATAPPTPRSTP